MIKVNDIVKIYKNGNMELKVLKGLNLEVKEGEYVAFMGPSGSGKSTLMNILGCLDSLTSGTYILDNQDVSTIKGDALANVRNKKIGFVFQTFNLLPKMTAVENVALPALYAGLKKAERIKKATEALESVGLGERIHHKPNEMSGGQRQRVAIARALANNPKILLSDEATSALDPRTTNSILELLKDINKKFGITIILITHQMEVIKKICNKTAIMSDGRIIEKGETKEIFLNPKTDLAKEFVVNISHEEFRTEEEKKHREENNGKLRLRLKYNEEQVNESYITKIIRKYDVEVNILSGFIDKVGDIIVGNLLIEISASEEKAKDIIEWLNENKIDSEVL